MEEDRPTVTENSRLRPSGKRKLRVRIFIFLVCIAISAAMWVFIELMKDYTTDIRFTVAFTNVPEDLILINQADSTVTVGVTAQGFELFVAEYLRKPQVLELNLKDLRITPGPEGYSAFIPATRLLEQVGRQLTFSKAITSIRPDTLMFRFSEIYRKQVPVKSNLSINFANEYQMMDTIRIIPDKIVVSSIKDVIDTLRFITTQRIELNGVDSNVSMQVPLKKVLRNNMIRFSRDSVLVQFKAQKFTEAVYTVPVNVSGNILPVRIFPDQVEVTCLVPLSVYKDVDASDFAATVNASSAALATSKRLPVKLTQFPAYVRSIRLKPDQVEYIIISR